jgi:hypothetical protein
MAVFGADRAIMVRIMGLAGEIGHWDWSFGISNTSVTKVGLSLLFIHLVSEARALLSWRAFSLKPFSLLHLLYAYLMMYDLLK